MTRAGFILAATLMITSSWSAAQETPIGLPDAAPAGLGAETIHQGGLVEAAPPRSESWAPVSQLTSLTADLDEQPLDPPKVLSFDSETDYRAIEFGADTRVIGDQECRHCGADNTGQCHQTDAFGGWVCDGCGSGCDVSGRPLFGFDRAVRFGWWAVSSEGSPVKVGEFQDLSSSAFWDLDGIWTDGSRTFSYTLSGLDEETNDVQAYFYGGPRLTVKFAYERFLHRLGHEPLAGYDLSNGPPAADDKVVAEDLNVGEDYAIRVQQLNTRLKGQLTNNVKWKVDLWGMRKSGERQANATAHCFNVSPPPAGADYTCHVLSQRQNIDWTTMEIKPAIEAKIGNSVVEYSRTMRAFGQNDQVVERTYTAFDYSPVFGTEGPSFVYGWVPENFTQIDRLKLNVPVNEDNQFYAHLYFGDTENKFRETHRNFNGYDVRLTNREIDDVTVTAYAKFDSQTNQIPTSFLTTPPFGVNSGNPGTFEPGSLRHPIDYNHGRIGVKGRWQSRTRNWLSVAGGYEFADLSRNYANYNTLSGPFTQEDTKTHRINFGPYLRVSPTLDAFVRYRGGFIDNPLIGVREADGKFNTNQPEQEHRVEIGGTWSPTSNFMVTSLFGIENSWNYSQYAEFDEDNYPILFTFWYAPSARLSVTGGYAYLSNWIDQDITIGFLDNPTETTRWNYGGYNNLFNIAATYAYSECTQFVGGFEWNRGSNTFSVPASPAGADWSALPTFSDVIVETARINLGVDHEFGSGMNGYFRYVYFDYEDLSADYNSGTANMFLAGLTILH